MLPSRKCTTPKLNNASTWRQAKYKPQKGRKVEVVRSGTHEEFMRTLTHLQHATPNTEIQLDYFS